MRAGKGGERVNSHAFLGQLSTSKVEMAAGPVIKSWSGCVLRKATST